jgi:hypothetical protein
MTHRQKLAASKMVENGGNMGKAMLEAGYSKAMAKNPYKLTRSKGWAEFVKGMLSEEEILKKHKTLLHSEKMNKLTFPASMSDEEIYSSMKAFSEAKVMYIKLKNNSKTCFFTTPNNSVIFKAMELGYKLRGLLKPAKKKQIRDENYSQETEEVVKRIRSILPASSQQSFNGNT